MPLVCPRADRVEGNGNSCLFVTFLETSGLDFCMCNCLLYSSRGEVTLTHTSVYLQQAAQDVPGRF